jgi:hypothetical protein
MIANTGEAPRPAFVATIADPEEQRVDILRHGSRLIVRAQMLRRDPLSMHAMHALRYHDGAHSGAWAYATTGDPLFPELKPCVVEGNNQLLACFGGRLLSTCDQLAHDNPFVHTIHLTDDLMVLEWEEGLEPEFNLDELVALAERTAQTSLRHGTPHFLTHPEQRELRTGLLAKRLAMWGFNMNPAQEQALIARLAH